MHTAADPTGNLSRSYESPAMSQPPDTAANYDAFAGELYATNIISDPWLEGRERFQLAPVVLQSDLYRRMGAAAEAIARAYDELAAIVLETPELLDSYFGMTPYQKLMWLASSGRWHGIARLDLFVLADGRIQACEMNSDTPSGEAETVLINQLRHRHHPELTDPNAGFEQAFVDMVLGLYGASRNPDQEAGMGSHTAPGAAGAPLSIGILYPTDLPEDLSMIAIYRQWFERRGHSVTLGSPFNIQPADDGRVALFDTPIDIAIRHYKSDWWGERIPAWLDEDDYDDPAPIDRQLRLLLDADARGTTTVVNPFGAVLTQNKLTMAFLWDHIDRFSRETRETIVDHIPETRLLRSFANGDLVQADWVLKSDYGCEGDEVVIGRNVSEAIWAESLEAAVRERWVVQRFFQAAPNTQGAIPNYGLYLVAGRTAGIFTRLSPAATDYSAVVAPTFVA